MSATTLANRFVNRLLGHLEPRAAPSVGQDLEELVDDLRADILAILRDDAQLHTACAVALDTTRQLSLVLRHERDDALQQAALGRLAVEARDIDLAILRQERDRLKALLGEAEWGPPDSQWGWQKCAVCGTRADMVLDGHERKPGTGHAPACRLAEALR